jgi:uncharacterized repeat protein (TIGR01451 family)
MHRRWRVTAAIGLTLFAIMAVFSVQAHNLQTKMNWMFFDPATEQMIEDRIAARTPGDTSPVLVVGDKLGIIIKVVPQDGTTTGVGGYIDFYIPNGTRVTDVAYVIPDGAGDYTQVPMKGQSLIAVGNGPVGTNCTPELAETSFGEGDHLVLGPNYNGVTADAVDATDGCHNGTIAGVYGDVGVFYSTHPDTAYSSWNGAPRGKCGLALVDPDTPNPIGDLVTNNSGDSASYCNKYDVEQLSAWGMSSPNDAIVDPNQRGNAPWGTASGVPGPESGYEWGWDMDIWNPAWFDVKHIDVIAGKLDLDQSGTADDNGTFREFTVINGLVDFDGSGTVDTADDGLKAGWRYINGYLDLDTDGVGGNAGDAGTIRETTYDAGAAAIRDTGTFASDHDAMIASIVPGPFRRIQQAGSTISDDTPGLESTELGRTASDASTIGWDLDAAPLATTVSQEDTTSPKLIRWSIGQLTDLNPEYAWVEIELMNANPADPAGIYDAQGCPLLHGDTFGGDAGGSDNGKDHLWRYYEPTEVTWNLCVGAGKVGSNSVVAPGDTQVWDIDVYNLGTNDLTNVVVEDLLPGGVTFISANPAADSGPNPLVWNVGDLAIGEAFHADVTVEIDSSGDLENVLTVTSDKVEVVIEDITPSGNIVILNADKSVNIGAAAPGDSVQYTLTIDNIGTATSGSPIIITENLPDGFTYTSLDSVTINGFNGMPPVTTVDDTDPQFPIFNVNQGIDEDESLVLVFTATIDPAQPVGDYCNSYTATQNGIPTSTNELACVTVGAGKIGDTVFIDWDGDGVQDDAENGLPGVTLNLYAHDGDAVFEPTVTIIDGLVDVNGDGEITAADDGNMHGYEIINGYVDWNDDDNTGGEPDTNDNCTSCFNGLDLVEGKVDLDDNGTADDTGSMTGEDGPPIATEVTADGTGSDPAGYYEFAGLLTPDDYLVVVDESTIPTGYTQTADPDEANQCSTCDAQSPVTLGFNQTVDNVDFGYQPGGAGATISGRVFDDANTDGDDEDDADDGIEAVTVNLYVDADGDGILDPEEIALGPIATDVTDSGAGAAEGAYSFTDVPLGFDYIVAVDVDDPDIDNYTGFTEDAIDQSTPTELSVQNLAANVTDQDFGFFDVTAAEIGDLVFADNNANGVFDAGDEVLAGVDVFLYLDVDNDGVFEPGGDDGSPVQTETTDGSGNYLFLIDTPDGYWIDVDAGDVTGGYSPTIDPIYEDVETSEVNLDIDFPFVQVLRKAVDVDSANSGDTLTYTITPTYTGTELLTNVQVTDYIPTGSTYVADSADPEADADPDPLVWSLGSNDMADDGSSAGCVDVLRITGAAGTYDTFLEFGNQTRINGANADIKIDSRSGSAKHGLISFDLTTAGIPVNSEIKSARMGFYVNTSKVTDASVHEMTTAWTEAEASWDIAKGTDTWKVARGNTGASDDFSSDDYSATSLGLMDLNTAGVWQSVSITPSIVQNWFDNPGQNYGVALIATIDAADGDGDGDGKFSASDNGTASDHPIFYIEYSNPEETTCATGGMAVFDRNSNNPFSSEWSGTTFGAATDSGVNLGQKQDIIVGAASPLTNEFIVGIVEDNDDVSAMTWDAITESWSEISISSMGKAENFFWGVGVQYEQTSGDPIMFWGEDTAELEYSIRTSGTWSTAAPITAYTTGLTSADVEHLRSAADPNSDEVVLVVADVSSNLHALVWDGSSWGDAITLASGGSNQEESIHVAYESQTGRAMVVYQKENGTSDDSNVYYRIWTGSAWLSEASVAPPAGPTGETLWATLASDPNSDNIALGVHTSDGDNWAAIWDGSAWGSKVDLSDDSSNDLQAIQVAFESDSGDALVTYLKSDTTGDANAVVWYRVWTGGSWQAEASDDPDESAVKDMNAMYLASDPASDQIMLAVQDSDSDLHYICRIIPTILRISRSPSSGTSSKAAAAAAPQPWRRPER